MNEIINAIQQEINCRINVAGLTGELVGLTLAKNIVEDLTEELQLNENQQIVLEWLKTKFTSIGKSNLIAVVYLVHFENRKTTPEHTEMWMAYRELTKHQEAQVLQAFSAWALEQEEE